jgi:hypothetical protein
MYEYSCSRAHRCLWRSSARQGREVRPRRGKKYVQGAQVSGAIVKIADLPVQHHRTNRAAGTQEGGDQPLLDVTVPTARNMMQNLRPAQIDLCGAAQRGLTAWVRIEDHGQLRAAGLMRRHQILEGWRSQHAGREHKD